MCLAGYFIQGSLNEIGIATILYFDESKYHFDVIST